MFFSTSFTKINSSWKIYELIRALEIKAFILLNLVFGNSTILSCFFYFSWRKNIAQIFSPTAELIMLIEKPTKEAKKEIETQPVIQISKCLIQFKVVQILLCFLLIISFLIYDFSLNS